MSALPALALDDHFAILAMQHEVNAAVRRRTSNLLHHVTLPAIRLSNKALKVLP